MVLFNCTNSRPGGHRVYGDCIYSTESQKCRTPAKPGNGNPRCCHVLKNEHTKQASNCAGFKNCIVKWLLSKCTMCSSEQPHGRMSALWTAANVFFPDLFYQIRHPETGIPLLKLLVSLKLKNKLQIFGFHAIVKKAVIADFLESCWKHMHKKTSDKLLVV